MERIGYEFQLPLRQTFDVGSVQPFERLFHQLSPYHRRPLEVEDLVRIADQSVFFLTAYDLDHGEELRVHRLVGMTRMVMCSPLGPLQRGEIHDTVVLPGRRRERIGEALTRKVIDQARQLGYGSIELTVKPARTEAVALYEKLGFKLVSAADQTVPGSESLYRLDLSAPQKLRH